MRVGDRRELDELFVELVEPAGLHEVDEQASARETHEVIEALRAAQRQELAAQSEALVGTHRIVREPAAVGHESGRLHFGIGELAREREGLLRVELVAAVALVVMTRPRRAQQPRLPARIRQRGRERLVDQRRVP